MQTPQDRLTNLMDSLAGKQKLGDKIKCQASGPQLVMAPDQHGQTGLQMGWQLTLWLEHNKLIGQDPIGVSVPVGIAALGGTMLPPDVLVEQAVKQMLEKAREIRHQQENPETRVASADEMLANMRDLSRA